MQEFAQIAESQLELASVEQGSSELQPNSGKLLLRARFFGKRIAYRHSSRSPHLPDRPQHPKIWFLETRWTAHTHTSRHGLDVPRRGKCYIPKDKSTVNSGEEQRARTFPYVLSHKAKCFRRNKMWRKRVGVEPTPESAKDTGHGFEDHEDHRTPFASANSIADAMNRARRAARHPDPAGANSRRPQ